ncbi:MAG: dihydroorotate dehydrogenase electron transfer subunit [Muribaculaceae bacterium]|nr:dihydroorotate dehydrogenase electron transfer subunit [Muribaculaceae bacterium]
MRQLTFKITANEALTPLINSMWLEGVDEEVRKTVKSVVPGQFINAAIEGCYLRRPVSVCDVQNDKIRIVYKVVGKGTALMREMHPDTSLDILVPLGNGFDISRSGRRPLLIGGGVGVPPLLFLARKLKESGVTPDVVLGFNSGNEIILAEEFRSLGCDIQIATLDGSTGQKGFVTDTRAVKDSQSTNSFYYACGPLPMLRAIQGQLGIDGQLSVEERMGCGFGICMGCTCHTKSGARQVCTHGPVFQKDDIIL